MKNLIISGLFIITILASCQKEEEKPVSESSSEPEVEIVEEKKQQLPEVELDQTTLIVIEYNSEQMDKLKNSMSEEDFMEVGSDLLYYDGELMEYMQKNNIPVQRFEHDTLVVRSGEYEYMIVKDDDFGVYEYFLFDGKKLEEINIFDFL